MRRPAPALPISPSLLKHFAAATLAITACIALFADGSASEAAVDQVKAGEARQAEVDMAKSRKQTQQGLKVRNGGSSVPVEGGEGPDGGGETYFHGGAVPAPITGGPPRLASGPPLAIPPPLPMTPGASVTVKGVPVDQLPPTPASAARRKANQPQGSIRPTEEQIAEIHEASRLRSGASAVD